MKNSTPPLIEKIIRELLQKIRKLWLKEERKRELASKRLKREASWREAVAEYKAYLKDMVNGKETDPQQMKKFDEIYERLKE